MDDIWLALALCISHLSCTCMDASWCTAGARVARSRATASQAKSWSMTTLSCHAISCLSPVKLGGCPPSGGGGRSGRRALNGIAPALLCRGVAGGPSARSPAEFGHIDGPTEKATVGFLRRVPSGAGHGNPSPVGSAARRARASVQMTLPVGRGPGWLSHQISPPKPFHGVPPRHHAALHSIPAYCKSTDWCPPPRRLWRQIRWWPCCDVEATPLGIGGMGRNAGMTPAQNKYRQLTFRARHSRVRSLGSARHS